MHTALIHLAKDATQAFCGETVTVRNCDAYQVTCRDCQRKFEDQLWEDVNRAKQHGDARMVDGTRGWIGQLHKAWDKALGL